MEIARRFAARTALAVGLCVVLGLVFTISTALGQGSQGAEKARPTATPDNRSSGERATAYISGFNDFMARRAKWIEDFQSSGKDASTLPRIAKAASYSAPQPSLAAALQNADLVIEGTVTRATYSPSGTVGTVQIAAIHKASPNAVSRLGIARPTEVQVALGYGPEPDPAFSTGKLVVAENQPVLLPGARAVLFLRVEQTPGQPPFAIQSFTGGYEIDKGGTIVPVRGNPFADQVRGLTAEQFASLVVRELSGQSP